MPGNVLQTVTTLNAYDGNSGRYDTTDPALAQVTTSMVDNGLQHAEENRSSRVHRPVLDLDLSAQLVPSSTPGHWHLYLDVEVAHWPYMQLLEALEHAGILEPGYSRASQERGYTAVRLPWVRKDDLTLDPAVPMEHQRDPGHQCEGWQLQQRADGGRYCGACGRVEA